MVWQLFLFENSSKSIKATHDWQKLSSIIYRHLKKILSDSSEQQSICRNLRCRNLSLAVSGHECFPENSGSSRNCMCAFPFSFTVSTCISDILPIPKLAGEFLTIKSCIKAVFLSICCYFLSLKFPSLPHHHFSTFYFVGFKIVCMGDRNLAFHFGSELLDH